MDSAAMEQQFSANDLTIADLRGQLDSRMGSMKELFGILQQAAGDARGEFENSLTNIEYPDRAGFLTDLAVKMGSTTELASLEEIEMLWFELQREMTEQGKLKKFMTAVIGPDGNEVNREILRVGVFNIVSDGRYLSYNPETGAVSELLRQPPARYLESARQLGEARDGIVAFGLDPIRGQLLGLLVQTPTLLERIDQGGTVGYIIMVLGLAAALIAAFRFIELGIISARMSAQKRNPDAPDGGNPLGRVLQVFHANRGIDLESLELRLSEAVLKEAPGLTRFNMALKAIAVVAPLLGLLGTVTGMIITFQAITLFGTGDPKMMAGGISQALVTTVQGLSVAIPVVLLHTLLAGRSKALVEVLEQQATGMIAGYSEQQRGSAAS
jgi:biopolymer transport protein ExbB